MIAELVSGVSLVRPWLLWIAPLAAGALYLAYKRRSKLIPVKVSSLFLAQGILNKALQKRSSFPWRLLFNILFACILSLGAASLVINRFQNQSLAIVIDNSASMAYRNGKTSVFDQAKTYAKKLWNAQTESRISLFKSSPRLELVGTDSRDLELISLTSSVDQIEKDLNKLVDFNKVILLTDREIELENLSPQIEFSAPTLLDSSDYNNLGLSIEQQKGTLKVKLHSTLSGSLPQADLILSRHKNNFQIDSSFLPLSTPVKSRSSFEIAAPRESGLYSLKLATKEDIDRNPLDSTWYFDSTGASSDSPVALFSNYSISDLNLDRLSGIEFVEGDQQVSEIQSAIYLGVAPNRWPQHNALFILPPKQGIFETANEIRNAAPQTAFKWKQVSPLLKYLSFTQFIFEPQLSFDESEWFEALIEVAQGAVLAKRQWNNKVYYAAGFNLLPFDTDISNPNSILFLNILNQLQTEPTNPIQAQRSSLTPGFHRNPEDQVFAVNVTNRVESDAPTTLRLKLQTIVDSSRTDQSTPTDLIKYLIAAALLLLLLEILIFDLIGAKRVSRV